MSKVEIISASVRNGRLSDRVAFFFRSYLETELNAEVRIQDLAELNFPLFEERLAMQKEPGAKAQAFAKAIEEANLVVIVTPEYNGSFPASLKNCIDLLYPQWYHKPTAIVTVSDGDFGGSQVIVSLSFILWKMKAWLIPAQFPVPNVHDSFDEAGNPINAEALQLRLKPWLKEVRWVLSKA